MKGRRVGNASARVYGGLWQVLVEWFRVPAEAPALPVEPGEQVTVFRPSEGFLRYQKFWFWLVLTAVDIPLLALWILVLLQTWWAALVLAPLFLAAIVVPDIIAYVAIHLRYDTMWYALTPRSMRIRHGIWVIQEKTITFDNVQNLAVRQGPVERVFGIGRVIVRTAGGGGGEGQGGAGGHTGKIEGVDNAAEIRDLIMDRVRRTKPAGVEPAATWSWTASHVAALHELRDALRPRPLEEPAHGS